MNSFDVSPVASFVTNSPTPPEHVLTVGRLLLLDTLGALAGGLRYPPVQALGRFLGTGYGPAVPCGRTVTLGTAATWLDADSGGSFHPQGARLPPVPTAHPAPHVLPVLLHEATRQSVTDEELVRVFVLACETGMRFGVGTTLRPGLHPHGIHGPVAAAVAACLLRGHDARTTARAMELAASLPLAATLAVPMAGGTVRNVWTGLGAYYGASAAGWAASGLPSSAEVLTDLYGVSVCTDLSAEEVGGELGTRWRILDSYLKPYACARWVHPALDALQLTLGRLPGGRAEFREIARIDVETFAFAASLNSVNPTSDLHARFSVPLSVAAVLLDGHLHAGSYLPGALARPGLRALAERVHLVEEPQFSAALPRERPARVRVQLHDGTAATAEVRAARGNPENPLSVGEIVTKFAHNVGELLDPGLRDAVTGSLAGEGPPEAATLRLAANALFTEMQSITKPSTTPTP